MRHVRDANQELEDWRPGVRTRMYVSALTGSSQLVIFEQWCDPGHGAPLHFHAVEEVLRVLAGRMRIFVADEEKLVGSGESVIIPAGIQHGFENVGTGELHTQAILAESVFDVHYVDSEVTTHRWLPVGSVKRDADRLQNDS